ncbi:MAG: serine protease [Verrucomicrobia bacterium]|nr:serine protease [Verrucomicrobiota bacterium]
MPMARAMIGLASLLAGLLAQGCMQPPLPERVRPGPLTRHLVAERVSAVVVTRRQSIQDWADRRFPKMDEREDVDGGSAVPITPDGYFLTADHVLARVGGERNAFVIYRWEGRLMTAKARVVWRSASADLALLHVPHATPRYYRWTPPDQWLPEGTRVIHGGIATGYKSPTGKLTSTLAPEHRFTLARRFKISIRLQPGDSGGPVVSASGGLIGINSAVEFLVPMDTAIFVDSEGNRPNTRLLDDLIKCDRRRNSGTNAPVEQTAVDDGW